MTNDILIFLLRGSMSASILYLFYLLMLRRHSNRIFSRFYLVLSLFFAALVPLIDIEIFKNSILILESNEVDSQHLVTNAKKVTHISYLFIVAYFLGLVFFISRFFISLFSILRITGKAEKHFIEGHRILVTPSANPAFSFFNTIYVSPKIFTDKVNLPFILAHELAHKNHLHSIDMVLVNLYCAIFWFNPISYLIRREVVTAIEHQADQQVCQTFDKKNYIETLLKYQTITRLSIANQFGSHRLIDRIKQIGTTSGKKKKSSWLSFAYCIPVILIVTFFLGGHVQAAIAELETGKAEKCECEGIHLTPDNKVIVEKQGKYGLVQTLEERPSK
ncbi:MAG: M56 family metallopeptidase [Bacteroidota bacterium]